MRAFSFALLLLPCAAHASFQTVPKHGTFGSYLIEAKDAQGAWKEAGRLRYDFHAKEQTLRLPAALAASGELRVTALSNEENQLDAVRLFQAGRSLKLRTATDSRDGQDLRAKLASADHDVKEVGHAPVFLRFAKPAAGPELSFHLHARSAKQDEFLGYPFWVRDQAGPRQVSYRLEPREGQALSMDSGVLKSSSGHPSAPILGSFKVEGGRLKGSVDFGPDNDPGPDDYVTLLARDEKGGPHEFKVGMQAGRWGRPDYVYGPAARWQYMRFHFDVPLAELPRTADGSLGLELLAYGTACGNLDNDARSSGGSHTPPSPQGGDLVNLPLFVYEGSGVYAQVPHAISVTCVVVDGSGNTVFNQTKDVYLDACGNSSSGFVFPSICPDNYYAFFKAVGNPDYNPTNGDSTANFTVGGSCATATPTSTPSPCPALVGLDDADGNMYNEGVQFTEMDATGTGMADTMSVRIDSVVSGTPQLKMAVYNSSYNLLASTGAITITGPGLFSAALGSQVLISAGQSYKLGVMLPSDATVRLSRKSGRAYAQDYTQNFGAWDSSYSAFGAQGIGDAPILLLQSCNPGTPTVTPTLTATPTASPSSTRTPSPTRSATGSPSASATITPSSTATPSATVTLTVTDTETPTGAQLTQTSVAQSWTPTPTIPAFARSEAGGPRLGPVPAKRGEPLRLYFEKRPDSSGVEVYNAEAQLVATLGLSGDAAPSLATDKLAPGIYYVKVSVDGKPYFQKIAILP